MRKLLFITFFLAANTFFNISNFLYISHDFGNSLLDSNIFFKLIIIFAVLISLIAALLQIPFYIVFYFLLSMDNIPYNYFVFLTVISLVSGIFYSWLYDVRLNALKKH